jgi:phage repressor protein C with HTH and peptisase S24 domain
VSRPFDVQDPKAYAVLVRSDSMLPTFRPGLWVIASPRAPVEDGDEVVVQLRTRERWVKIARRVPGGYLLESSNPTYPPRFVTNEEIVSMHAIVYARRKRPGRRVVVERDDQP